MIPTPLIQAAQHYKDIILSGFDGKVVILRSPFTGFVVLSPCPEGIKAMALDEEGVNSLVLLTHEPCTYRLAGVIPYRKDSLSKDLLDFILSYKDIP